MKCPRCGDAALAIGHRQGVEIDRCPACRGVWLDRGELDKLLDRAASQTRHSPGNSGATEPDFVDSDDRQGPRDSTRRRRSGLDDIFD